MQREEKDVIVQGVKKTLRGLTLFKPSLHYICVNYTVEIVNQLLS